MKRLSALLSSLLLVAASSLCWGQQALWEGSKLISPEIHADNSVTFRFKAPKAVKVEIVGDFLPPVGGDPFRGKAEMTEGEDGVWTYTSAPLEPELYSYCIYVDGLRNLDPSNVFVNRDVISLSNIFIISKEKGDKGWLYGVNDVPHGNVTSLWYDSPTLGMKRRMTVYTPAGYNPSAKKRYPVMYLLHGSGGDEEAWMSLGRASQIMDNLIASGQAEPMIVVMTNGNSALPSAPGEGPEGLYKPNTRKVHAETTFPEAFFDVVSFIDSNYKTIAKGSSRAVCGLSMGGGHSYSISKMYPGDFAYVGLFSASVRSFRADADPSVLASDKKELAKQFASPLKLYYIAIGKDDFLYDENSHFRAYLDAKGYPYTYVETDGGHTWRNWRIYLPDFARRIFK